jgi:hypothetical protein
VAASQASFDPLGLLRVLLAHGVTFIVIGGVAARTHGSPSLTRDLDICYERSRPNLERLARALQELHATLRGAPPDLPFRLDVGTLAVGDSFTFATDAGDLDCLGTPSGTDGYPDLIRNAADVELADLVVKVVGLEDLIRMKRAAGRPKDRIELEVLGALRDEIDGEPEQPS